MTQRADDGVRIGREIATSGLEDGSVLVVAGGDGTTHELIQGLRAANAGWGGKGRAKAVGLVVLPTGTVSQLHETASDGSGIRGTDGRPMRCTHPSFPARLPLLTPRRLPGWMNTRHRKKCARS